MRRDLITVVLLLAGTACGGAGSGTSPSAGSTVPATFEHYDAGAVAGGPGAGTRYAFGRQPSDSLLGAWDTDVGKNGAELPPGKGSVAQGATLYAASCASCHGVGGVGGVSPNPALVGRDSSAEGFRFADDPKLVKTIGNYWPYATTVFDYIRRAMPPDAPGSLADSDVYDLTAFLLHANELIPANAVIDAGTLPKVAMPAREHFVPDTRRR